MSILEQINQEIIKGYKSGESERRVFLQTIKAALINKKIEVGENYSHDDEIKTLKTELKQRQEALGMFKQANRKDLIDKTKREISLIEEFLPPEMSDEEIAKIVKDKLNGLEDKSFGNVMRLVMGELKGKADGGRVAQVVNKLIK